MHRTYITQSARLSVRPNAWDLLAFLLVISVLAAFALGAKSTVGHYTIGQATPIYLDVWHLPYYALRTVLRMFSALLLSAVLTLVLGSAMAKSPHIERILLPIIDVGQSVPVLGYLSITSLGFVALFPGSLLGPECAAIFAILTAQLWNMILSFYQSLKMLPADMAELARGFRLTAWQKFWRIEVPFALPSLLWNTMLSMSASWVFCVANEAMIIVHGHRITLPGIGSYLAIAIDHGSLADVLWAIITMLCVIGLYDQLLFRPMIAWSMKFNAGKDSDSTASLPWVLALLAKTQVFKRFSSNIARFMRWLACRRGQWFGLMNQVSVSPELPFAGIFSWLWYLAWVGILWLTAQYLWQQVANVVQWTMTAHIFYLGAITCLRVFLLVVICGVIWVPVGIMIGKHPRAAQIVQPIAQFLAAFPANLLYPPIMYIIIHYQMNVNIWVTPLMILGAQWYVLFNVVAGVTSIPSNLNQATQTLHVTGWLRWRRFTLPAIFPHLITGAMTASGAAWNMSILAEVLQWKGKTIYATGLGAYITEAANSSHTPELIMGIAVMSVFVIVTNRLVWQKLHQFAQRRFHLS